MQRSKPVLVLMLVVMLALAACGGNAQAGPAPTSVPKNITGAAQPNSSTTLARGDYSRPLGSSGAQAPTEQQPAATASPTEAPKAEQPQALTETDITNIGTIIDWPLDESGQVGGVQLRFAKDMDLSAIPWIVEIHVKGATVKSVKANDVGTVWISPALRPALNKLVDEIESKKKSAAPAPAAPKAATATNNSAQANNANPPKPVVPAQPAYKGPKTVLQILQYGGSVKDLLNANGQLAGVLLESSDQNVFARLRSAGVDCRGDNPQVQSCWIPPAARPLKDDRPAVVYPPRGAARRSRDQRWYRPRPPGSLGSSCETPGCRR